MLRTLETHGYQISASLLMLSTLVSALELASIPGLYIDLVLPGTRKVNKRAIWVGLHLGQAALSIVTWVTLLAAPRVWFQGCFLTLGILVAISYRLRATGKDGADQVRMLSFWAYAIGFLLDGEDGVRIPQYFMGVQIIIAYATAGIAKVCSEHWRNGNAVSQILSAYSMGWPSIGGLLSRHPRLDRVSSYAPILMMLSVPVMACLPFQAPLMVSLALMLGFHALAALLMGLNDFILTFPSAYPGLLLLHALVFDLAS